MADPADARHENHAHGPELCQPLRIVTGAARQVHGLETQARRRRRNLRLDQRLGKRRGIVRDTLQRDLGIGLSGDFLRLCADFGTKSSNSVAGQITKLD